MWHVRFEYRGPSADENPQHSAEKANRVTVLPSAENIEGVTSVIFESHKGIYQFKQKNGKL